jgi:hypothetical protein
MLIRPRQVRRSKKFTTRLQTGARQRREYTASTYSTAVIKAMLAVAMVVAGIKAYQAFDTQTSNVSLTIKLAVPFMFIAGALLVAWSCVRNIRSVRDYSHYNSTRRDR